ncbi:MAG: DUF2905 domain-containing protein [Caldilineales bacterium]|nr:DUF2905 domain-containing protein [Caldilineales bacterium]
MSSQQLGLIVIGIGVLVILTGALIWLGALSWFGNLPGDIRIDNGNVKIFIPITSMLLLSLGLSVLLALVRRFLS